MIFPKQKTKSVYTNENSGPDWYRGNVHTRAVWVPWDDRVMRTMDDVLRQELAAFRARTGKVALRVLEVGCARSTHPDHEVGDGWSSLTLARDAQKTDGSLAGIDLDTRAAAELIGSHGLTEEFFEGSSLDVLPELAAQGRTFDVIFLDSGNDPDLVLSEFILSLRLIVRPGLLLADDMDQKDPEVVKGVKLIPYLKDNGYAYRLTHRETPWTNRDILVMDFT